MKFIDLFAGLGGFHNALHKLGHECVFASEIDPTLQSVYEHNWGIRPEGDIRKIVNDDIDKIPKHDILCAGFPCQPFSKAGKQLGLNDEERGTLFDEIVKILDYRKPEYFILENVPFIAKHDNEETWNYMSSTLRGLGYDVDHKNYSPHQFGIPQNRLRIFIVGKRSGLGGFSFESVDKLQVDNCEIEDFIDNHPRDAKPIPEVNSEILDLWQEFVQRLPKNVKIPGFPIWGMEFGADYPYEGKPPALLTKAELAKYKGNFGKSLDGLTKKEQLAALPSYARVTREFPAWKKKWIGYNRQFYIENEPYISDVVLKIAGLPHQSWQKLEWNVGAGERDIFKHIIQFRASGVRIKKADRFPSLVCTSTQVPILGWKKRYLSTGEGLKLQSLDGLKFLPPSDNSAFKALGNAVNSHIVGIIANHLIGYSNSPYSHDKTSLLITSTHM